jgi:hypothetical protein
MIIGQNTIVPRRVAISLDIFSATRTKASSNPTLLGHNEMPLKQITLPVFESE